MKTNFTNSSIENPDNLETNKKKNGCLKIFIAIVIFSIFVWMVGKCSSNSENNEKETTNQKVESPIIESKIDSVKAKELSKLFTEKKDKFEESSWIIPKIKPSTLASNGFYCYFEKNKSGVSNFRFQGQYYADDWLFVNKVIFNIDGKNYEYFPKKMDRDNGSGFIWEWFDDNISNDNVELIRSIAKAKKVSIRWNGQTYYNDKELSSNYIKSIKNTLEYYEALGGKFY